MGKHKTVFSKNPDMHIMNNTIYSTNGNPLETDS